MPASNILTRRLPERSKLLFYFPNPDEGDQYTLVRMPFYENLTVTESKRARYKDHSILGRSSDLYTYLGANSRSISINFNITLSHIMEEYPNVTEDGIIFKNRSSKGSFIDKKLFLNPVEKGSSPGNNISQKMASLFYNGEDYVNSVSNVIEDPTANLDALQNDPAVEGVIFGGNNTANGGGQENQPSKIKEFLGFPKGGSQKNKVRRNIINVIIYWINIIRSSVVNNANNPIYGPPIIRLRHGIMYQDIPCICKNYNFEFIEEAGYDLETLLPRQITVSMELEEFRVGDFGEFSGGSQNLDIVKRDNLAGWEAVLDDYGSMDPGYSILNDQ